jgi:hypothetical protein
MRFSIVYRSERDSVQVLTHLTEGESLDNPFRVEELNRAESLAYMRFLYNVPSYFGGFSDYREWADEGWEIAKVWEYLDNHSLTQNLILARRAGRYGVEYCWFSDSLTEVSDVVGTKNPKFVALVGDDGIIPISTKKTAHSGNDDVTIKSLTKLPKY